MRNPWNTLEQCTEEASESDPAVVMRNVRQFVNGIKNYLVRNGEQGRLTEVIDEERERVGALADILRCIFNIKSVARLKFVSNGMNGYIESQKQLARKPLLIKRRTYLTAPDH